MHPHERAIGPIGVPVNEAGEYVFSHTRLTEDENGNIRLSNVPSDINDSQHPRIRSYESLPGICALLIQSLNFRARFGQVKISHLRLLISLSKTAQVFTKF